jgi:PKD domain
VSRDFGGRSAALPILTALFAVTAFVLVAATSTAAAGGPAAGDHGLALPSTLGPFPPLPVSHNPDDVNVSTTFNAAGLCPVGPCAFSYGGLPTGCTSTNTDSLACVPTVPGTYFVTAAAVPECKVSCQYGRATVLLTVNPALNLSAISAEPQPAEIGQSVQLSVNATGGSDPLAYAWTGLPAPCATENATALTCAPTENGSFEVNASVTDTAGADSWSNLSLLVDGPLVITSFQATPAAAAAGSVVQFTAVTSGGVGLFTYEYAGLPAGCVSQNLTSFSCAPNATGTFHVAVHVVDSRGAFANANLILTVTDPMAVTSFQAVPAFVDLGAPVLFSVATSGGVPPLSFAYHDLPPGCASVDAASFSCVPTRAGTFSPVVVVTDGLGAQATDSTSAVVHGGVVVAAAWAPAAVDVSHAATLSVNASNGAPPYSYSYTGLPANCPTVNAPTLSCDPATSGTFATNVTVSDKFGQNASFEVNLTVNAPPIVNFTTNRSAGPPPLAVAFAPAVTGGTGPFTYLWNFGDGTTSLLADPSHTYQTTGNFNVVLQITDNDSEVASSLRSVQVTSTSGLTYPVTIVVTPTACGTVKVGTQWADNGTVLQLAPGSYTIQADSCSGQSFAAWEVTGVATLTNSSRTVAEVHLAGPGTLSAMYSAQGSSNGTSSGFPTVLGLSPLIETVLIVAILVAAVWGLVYLGRRPARQNPPPPST